jgi:hypothetical protein
MYDFESQVKKMYRASGVRTLIPLRCAGIRGSYISAEGSSHWIKHVAGC